jgi:hypothetical protein
MPAPTDTPPAATPAFAPRSFRYGWIILGVAAPVIRRPARDAERTAVAA